MKGFLCLLKDIASIVRLERSLTLEGLLINLLTLSYFLHFFFGNEVIFKNFIGTFQEYFWTYYNVVVLLVLKMLRSGKQFIVILALQFWKQENLDIQSQCKTCNLNVLGMHARITLYFIVLHG